MSENPRRITQNGIIPACFLTSFAVRRIVRLPAERDFMPKKILLVEDNTELLELLCMNCEDAGFSTATATNGVEALEKARAFSPDLIVLDLVLPELDGFAVCETLRKDPATASVPIIMLTGLSSQFSRFAGLESGGTDFFTKPTSPNKLVSRIKHLLERGPAASTTVPN